MAANESAGLSSGSGPSSGLPARTTCIAQLLVGRERKPRERCYLLAVGFRLELMAMPPRLHNTSAYVSTVLWSATALAQWLPGRDFVQVKELEIESSA